MCGKRCLVGVTSYRSCYYQPLSSSYPYPTQKQKKRLSSFLCIKQLLQRERRAQFLLHFSSFFPIQVVVQQQMSRGLQRSTFPKASTFFILSYYFSKGFKIAFSQLQLKESRLQPFRIFILRSFKRKGIASFIDPSIVFSFILILLPVIFPLFQYLFSCRSPYIG